VLFLFFTIDLAVYGEKKEDLRQAKITKMKQCYMDRRNYRLFHHFLFAAAQQFKWLLSW
jgi:hypothetical protein